LRLLAFKGDEVRMIHSAWLIPVLPLLSFLIVILFLRNKPKLGSLVANCFSLITFILATLVLVGRLQGDSLLREWNWLEVGSTTITLGFEINALNSLMLFIVSFVSFLVNVYSLEYMEGDDRKSIFFAYLGLFTFAMLALVISPNLLQTYIFWELVGLGSFLLIGFYFYKDSARAAAKKAFIMTRIGDVGLLIGILLLFTQVGSFEYDEIFAAVRNGELIGSVITASAILIFIGAVGKSGQFPLHTWLPDAMEGPTPVSALIHAATMVAAGVYLVAATYPLFEVSQIALTTVAVVGCFTAIFAASIGLFQKDIKRVLAYSTVSQLGFMMLALGTSGYVAGVFHLTTHAFFKALLFLAAGSVIHAVHTQDIEEMGGLNKRMKITSLVFLIGTLAISGFPLFSGFFSKEEILISAWTSGNEIMFFIALFTAFLTSLYMFRVYFLVFTGETSEASSHAKESGSAILVPMLILAVFAVFSGFINTHWFGTYLSDFLLEDAQITVKETHAPTWILYAATIVSLAGIFTSYLLFGKNKTKFGESSFSKSPVYSIVYNKYYIDEIYDAIVVKPTRLFAAGLKFIEWFCVGGIMKTISGCIQFVGWIGSRLQSGKIQTYGTIAVFIFALFILVYGVTNGGLLK
jgi:NADH-quinone oxidoreductase subunit L